MRRVLAAGVFACVAVAGLAESLLRPDDRIIFVGDSITAQGAGSLRGYYHQFTNALQTVYPAYRNEVVALGFSGNTLFDWTDKIGRASCRERV